MTDSVGGGEGVIVKNVVDPLQLRPPHFGADNLDGEIEAEEEV